MAFVEAATIGLFDDEDAAMLCEGMAPGSAVAGLAIEHTWAVELANAIAAEGGEMGMNYRIPAPAVDEAIAALKDQGVLTDEEFQAQKAKILGT